MEFGFSLPGRGPLASIDVVLKLAEKADALRFDSLFVTDHVVMPVASGKSVYPYTTSGQFPGGLAQDYLEPLATLSHLAHATKRARLGTCCRRGASSWARASAGSARSSRRSPRRRSRSAGA